MRLLGAQKHLLSLIFPLRHNVAHLLYKFGVRLHPQWRTCIVNVSVRRSFQENVREHMLGVGPVQMSSTQQLHVLDESTSRGCNPVPAVRPPQICAASLSALAHALLVHCSVQHRQTHWHSRRRDRPSHSRGGFTTAAEHAEQDATARWCGETRRAIAHPSSPLAGGGDATLCAMPLHFCIDTEVCFKSVGNRL